MPSKLQYAPPAESSIREGLSVAMHADRVSALDLPAELRNQIYAIRLEFDDPLKIGGNDVGRLYRHIGDKNTSLKRFKPHKRDNQYDGLPVHSIHPGRNLFLTCRQIYHETASFFFGMNEFHITECHEPYWPTRWHEEEFDQHHQDLVGALSWLNTLGSQLALLRRVVVDVNTLRPKEWLTTRRGELRSDSRDEWRQWDLLPLVRFIWSRGDDVPRILLVYPFNQDGRVFHKRNLLHHFHLSKKEICLNRMLQRLSHDDLDFEKKSLLISTIGLNENATRGYISYFRVVDNYYSPCPDSWRSFKFSRSGTLVFDEDPQASLLALPHALISQICREIMCNEHGILVDLDKKDYPMWKFIVSGLIYTNRQMRSWAPVVWNNGFVLKMTSSTSLATFNEFEELRKWLIAGSHSSHLSPTFRYVLFHPAHQYSGWGMARTECLNLLSIQLHLKVIKNIQMKHIRIGIMGFIRATSHIDDGGQCGRSDKIRIILSTRDDEGFKKRTVQQDFNLPRLRKSVAKALCYIVNEHLVWDAQCPEVFINGFGKPKAYRLAGSDEMHSIGNLQKMTNTRKLFGLGASFEHSTKHYMSYLWRAQSDSEAD